jgi:UDP-GlcNAc:undecaprenyl-phosphate GlcNAc-1-phosphate transferase
MLTIVCFFVFGFLVSVLSTPWVIRFCKQGIGLDRPDEGRKKQEQPIQRLGGLPIMLALTLGLGFILLHDAGSGKDWLPIIVGSVLIYGLGMWDDLRSIPARYKLLAQLLIAGLVYSMGLQIDKLSFFGEADQSLRGWSGPVTVFWLVAVPNIVNIIDGFDGLAGGLGLFLSVTLGIVGHVYGQDAASWYAFTLAGALLGFLVFNFPPAKIYLGDGGAYLIGFVIAALSLANSQKGSVAAVLLLTVLGLGLPILDTAFAILRRGVRGFPLFSADDEHFHHRLERLGFSKTRILFGLYGVCVVLSVIGLSIFWTKGGVLPIAIGIGVLFLLALAVVRQFHRVKTWEDARAKVTRVLGRRRAVEYALLQSRILALEVDRCGTGEEFWALFDATLRRVGFVNEGEAEDEVSLEVRHSGNRPWRLHAPRAKATTGEWQRIAECFRPVYMKAMQRWSR